MDYCLVNTASVSVGIGKIQLCHYNLVWGKTDIFDGTQSIYIHLVLNSTLYIFVSRKGCPAVVEILSRPFSQACGVRPFIHANSEGCRGRNNPTSQACGVRPLLHGRPSESDVLVLHYENAEFHAR